MKNRFIKHISNSRTFDVVLALVFVIAVIAVAASFVSKHELKENAVKFAKAMEQNRNHAYIGYADSLILSKMKIAVLEPQDEILYRKIFTLQKKGFFDKTEEIISEINNKEFVGYILAEKYLNHGMSFKEAADWLSKYSDLPQANDIYNKALTLSDFRKNSIKKPKNFVRKPIVAANLKPDSQLLKPLANLDEVPYEIEEDENINANALWDKGLASWKNNDFESASVSFSKLAMQPGVSTQIKAKAGFWAYRSYDKLKDRDKSIYWLSFSSDFSNSFYGVMAAHLFTKAAINSREEDHSILNETDIKYLSENAYGSRALALVQVGRSDLAEKELEMVLSSNPSPALNAASFALAEHAGIASILQRAAGLSKIAAEDNANKVYPIPEWEPGSGWSVNPALIYAIVKQESLFKVGAISPKGACGVMQIMPNTAKHIAKKTGESTDIACDDYNKNPEISLEMGQKYLQILSENKTIGDNLVFLLAAYNAGPSKVSNWISNNEQISDSLLFIESLPFRETRNYVKQVMLNYWVYGAKMDSSKKSKQVEEIIALANGKFPSHKVTTLNASKNSNNKKNDLKVSSL